MMMFLLFIGIVTYFCFYHFYWKRKNLPPGPTPLPLVGNLLELDRVNPQNSLFKWGQKYGPVYTFWMGPNPMVMINDFGIMKEYFTGKTANTFAFRMDQFMLRNLRDGKSGVLITDGALWTEQRRFSLHALRNLGIGRNLMEQKIQEQVQELLNNVHQLLEGRQQQPISLDHAINLCVGNVINGVIFGRVFLWKDPRFLEVKQLMDDIIEILGSFQALLLNQAPWLRFLPIRGHFGFDEFLRLKRRFWELVNEEIGQSQACFDVDAEPRDFVSASLREMAERKKQGNPGFFSHKQLANTAMDIWFGGQETTVTTLKWAVLYMVHRPDIQAKVQQELDQFYGKDSDATVSMKDKQSLHYTAATIQEIQRLGNVFPLLIPHTVGEDVQMQGYKFLKGTAVIPQISTVLIDPTVFPSPEKMDPTRFLDEHGKLKNVAEFAPFSLGKRLCLGESLAKMELFLIFSALLRHFEFRAIPGDGMPTLEPEIGLTRRPKEFDKILVKNRQK